MVGAIIGGLKGSVVSDNVASEKLDKAFGAQPRNEQLIQSRESQQEQFARLAQEAQNLNLQRDYKASLPNVAPETKITR